jgi:hypothetical protein
MLRQAPAFVTATMTAAVRGLLESVLAVSNAEGFFFLPVFFRSLVWLFTVFGDRRMVPE